MTNHRPGRRALPALGFLAALGVAGHAFGGQASGLAWPSGAREAGPESCLAAMRKRPLDVRMTFADHRSWSRLESFLASPWWKKMIRSAPTGVVSLALLTDDHARDWSECNSGKFDSEYSKIGSILAQSGARNLIIRLGWEANTAGSARLGPGPRRHRRLQAVLDQGQEHHQLQARLGAAQVRAEPGEERRLPHQPDDVLGRQTVRRHTGCPLLQQRLRRHDGLGDQPASHDRPAGGPQGITTWYNEARKAGVPLAIPEWALWNFNSPHPDDPTYIHNMKAWFKSHASGLAYETYFNVSSSHALCSSTRYPSGRAAYASDWASG